MEPLDKAEAHEPCFPTSQPEYYSNIANAGPIFWNPVALHAADFA
jgi:hypothetical protein